MLVQHPFELIEQSMEQNCGLLDKETIKQMFIDYVFETYQPKVVGKYGLDAFYEHLQQLKLVHCRSDFDEAVEQWFQAKYHRQKQGKGFHKQLFELVKEVVSLHQPVTRKQLVHAFIDFLTTPTSFMARWRSEKNEKSGTTFLYYRHLDRLGIRTYQDIEELIDSYLLGNPDTFKEEHQRYLSQQSSRRGRPQNIELSLLFQKVSEMKPELTQREKDRIRKIYYYHRKTLSTHGMVQKFCNYVLTKSNKNKIRR
ncbi:hypothetical protein [Brevibacillus dissolubilis]|uniref:hypothetical protein n=1 Tax=Brevibacillus dissolubilis TaxID=1844116 RepID=UPI001116DDB2|nr:hypothetical protein [Brevibacillus dissolubilis]